MTIGFGQMPFGRSAVGNVHSDYEPRFNESTPTDGSSDASIYQQRVHFDIYCFDTRIQLDDTLLIEVSEDGGLTYNDAYADEAFVAPYNDSGSGIDAQQADAQKFSVSIEKTSTWVYNEEILVRVTAQDGLGQVATKETVVTW